MFAIRPAFAQAAKVQGQPWRTGSSAALAAAAETADKAPSFEFHIPAQSLATALDRYAVITGNPVLFPSKLAIGRNASALNGHYEAGAALEILLQGTGLSVEQIHEGGLDTFVLKPMPAQDIAVASALRAGGEPAVSESYDALVQASVWEAFCGNAHTAPGSYRALLRFGIDGEGHVRQPRLLSSTGDKRRDAMLTDALGKVSVGRPPPVGLMQPLTMLMLPQGQIAGRPCHTEAH